MHLLVFAGTADGAAFIRFACRAGHSVTASVATEYGLDDLKAALGADSDAVSIIHGRMNQEQIQIYLRRNSFEAVIDATHPYASEATRNIFQACHILEIPFYRLRREESLKVDEDDVNTSCVDSVEEAVRLLNCTDHSFFLATGSSSIEQFAQVKDAETRLFVRVIPSIESIQKCRTAGVLPSRIIAMQGPFSLELNMALFRSTGARILVTKESGSSGGLAEKLEAARQCRMRTIIIARPQERIEEGQGFTLAQLAAQFGIRPQKRVILAAAGMGSDATYTAEARAALERAPFVLGAVRLLSALPPAEGQRRHPATLADDIAEQLEQWYAADGLVCSPDARPVVLLSGDTGFYSGAAALIPRLQERGWSCRVMPGVSTVAAVSARIGIPWQAWKLVSAHGRSVDICREVLGSALTFFLCGTSIQPQDIVAALCRRGAGQAQVYVVENLYAPSEKLTVGSAQQLHDDSFAVAEESLAAVLVDTSAIQGAVPQGVCGLPDWWFVRGEYENGRPVPMTKQCVRAAVLAKLALREDDVFFDVGAGTGSVSIEAALFAKCSVYAIEKEASACALIAANREKAAAWNIEIIEGSAPLHSVVPTAAFIGGSGGGMAGIIAWLLQRNPDVRIVLAAVTVEGLCVALASAQEHDLEIEVTQLSASASKPAGKLHMFQPQSPVFIAALRRRDTPSDPA